IPEHKRREFEYLGLNKEKIVLGRNVNIVENPPLIKESETPSASEEIVEPHE
ncbi:hypothetical protein KI387_026214, partial [Taxus chinensis]